MCDVTILSHSSLLCPRFGFLYTFMEVVLVAKCIICKSCTNPKSFIHVLGLMVLLQLLVNITVLKSSRKSALKTTFTAQNTSLFVILDACEVGLMPIFARGSCWYQK
jgi:hypothetical protein